MEKRQLEIKIRELFKSSGIKSYEFEARQIVNSFFGKICEQKILQLAKTRTNRYPLQYLLGEWEFYGLPIIVGEGVLIPRADTETLVDTALEILKKYKDPQVADLCSGSGCIALAIEKNSNATVTAVEKYEKAYEYLKKNIFLNNSKVKPILDDALSFCGKFDVVVSNPPYIETNTIDTLQKEVRFEPKIALDGGVDGLDFYRIISRNADNLIKPNGTLIFEIGYNQKDAVMKILENEGFSDISCVKDLNGNSRVIFGTYNHL